MSQPSSLSRLKNASSRASAWLARQSLPRLLGLLVGSTRELESRLDDATRQLESKDREIQWWKERYIVLEDSFLFSRGYRPTETTITEPQESSTTLAQTPAIQTAINVEVDKLVELITYNPQELVECIADLEKQNTPRAKEILRQFGILFRQLPPTEDPDSGVVIIS